MPPIWEPEDSRRSALEMKELLGAWGTYGSEPEEAPPAAACMPFKAPFADDVVPWTVFVGTGEP
jgi:hypothetical protein